MDYWTFHALLVAGLVIHGSNAGVTSAYNDNDTVTKNRNDDGENNYRGKTQSLDATSVISNVTSATTSITNLTTVLTTSLEATPPKHSPTHKLSFTPKMNPGGKSETGWLLLALGIVLLICTALLVSTITLACQVRNLRDQLSSVFPAHPPRVNADVIRVGKASEVMETEMEKAKDTVEKTVGEEGDAQETEVAAVPTAPPADPSSDCVLNV